MESLAFGHLADDGEAAPSVKAMHAGLLSSRGYVPDPYDAISFIYKPSRRSLSPSSTRGYTRSTLEAVHSGDVAALEALLRGGLDPNSQNKFGTTLLHRACSHSQARVVRLLLDSGAQARCADDGGKTPLHDLCWMGSVYPEGGCTIAHMLLSVDESLLRAHDRLGFTPLDYLRDAQLPLWAAFLDENKELFWSPRNAPGRSPEEWAAILWPQPALGDDDAMQRRPPAAGGPSAPFVRYAADPSCSESDGPDKADAAAAVAAPGSTGGVGVGGRGGAGPAPAVVPDSGAGIGGAPRGIGLAVAGAGGAPSVVELRAPSSAGAYCPSNGVTIPCPLYSYNSRVAQPSLASCLPCPAGTWCNAAGVSAPASFPLKLLRPRAAVAHAVRLQSGSTLLAARHAGASGCPF